MSIFAIEPFGISRGMMLEIQIDVDKQRCEVCSKNNTDKCSKKAVLNDEMRCNFSATREALAIVRYLSSHPA